MKTLDLFIAECEKPSHCSKRAMHDALAPIMDVVARGQMQAVELRRRINGVLLDDHDHRLDGKMERFRQAVGALDLDLAALETLALKVAGHFTTIDRYIGEDKDELPALAGVK